MKPFQKRLINILKTFEMREEEKEEEDEEDEEE